MPAPANPNLPNSFSTEAARFVPARVTAQGPMDLARSGQTARGETDSSSSPNAKVMNRLAAHHMHADAASGLAEFARVPRRRVGKPQPRVSTTAASPSCWSVPTPSRALPRLTIPAAGGLDPTYRVQRSARRHASPFSLASWSGHAAYRYRLPVPSRAPIIR